MTDTLTRGYSSDSTQQELSNEYQHCRVQMFFKNLCVLVFQTEVASALEGLNSQDLCGATVMKGLMCMVREIQNLDPQPHRYCMLPSTASAPQVIRAVAWGCIGHVICAVTSMQPQRDWLAGGCHPI